MTHFESLDEIYLMVVAGLANIQKSKYFLLYNDMFIWFV